MMRDLGLNRAREASLGQKTLAQATCPERKPAGDNWDPSAFPRCSTGSWLALGEEGWPRIAIVRP